MGKICFLCSSNIKIETINLKTKKTHYTEIHFLQFLQNLAPHISLLENCNTNICRLCFTLINDLDFAQQKCLDLSNVLLSYLDNKNVGNLKTERNESFVETNLVSETTKLKDTNEICCEENANTALGVFNQNDSIENVQISNKCNLCQTDFKSSKALALHVKTQHQDDKLDTKPPAEDELIEQLETKPKKPERKKSVKKKESCLKPYKCEQCGKAWKTTTELKVHLQSHSELRPFICEICGQSYKHKTALEVHIGMHKGINPFTCDYCNKSYTQKGSLERHILIHTGECPYQCDLCGKRYIHLSSFRIHQASHTGKKDFKCAICGIALLSLSHLKRHIRVHTGEKKFECTSCGKKFAERYNLMSHLKLHTQQKGVDGKEHKCEICNLYFERANKLEKHMLSTH